MTKRSSDIAKLVKSRIDSSDSVHRWTQAGFNPLSNLARESQLGLVADLSKHYQKSWIVRDTALEVAELNDGNELIADAAMYAEESVVEQMAAAQSSNVEDCFAKAGVLLDRAIAEFEVGQIEPRCPFERRSFRLLASLVRDLQQLAAGEQSQGRMNHSAPQSVQHAA
jgi:hypothetical protein